VPTPETTVTVEIPFHDIDLMGVVWHGHYFRYLEVARSALLDSISYNYREMRDSGYSWPVVDVRLRYLRPASLGQQILVRARLAEFELRLRIDYLITDAASGERLTKGRSIQVPVDLATGELVLGTPAVLYQKLGIAP
jgi:acyl-CoA thioester hydrolase